MRKREGQSEKGKSGESRGVPLRIVEKLHRWRHRRLYKMLPEFYRDFYPIENAVSLTMQYAEHTISSGQKMDAAGTSALRKVAELEKTITELRLALAHKNAGWNEDRVDAFMARWFGRRDLPTSDDAKENAHA